jgi:hypothetical protein
MASWKTEMVSLVAKKKWKNEWKKEDKKKRFVRAYNLFSFSFELFHLLEQSKSTGGSITQQTRILLLSGNIQSSCQVAETPF